MPFKIKNKVYCVCEDCGWKKRNRLVRGDVIINLCPEKCPKCEGENVNTKMGKKKGLIERFIIR